MLTLCLVIALSFIWRVDCACPSFTAKWSDFPRWNSGADVFIPVNSSILLDKSVSVNSIVVNGSLIFANQNIQLNVSYIKVNLGGSLIIGTEEVGCAITEKITITFFGNRTADSPLGYEAPSTLGSKGIAITSGSTLSIFGEVRAPVWTRLRETAPANATVIKLQEAVNWRVGDKILIVSTDYPALSPNADISNWFMRGNFPDQNEVRTIVAVNLDQVTLDSPLQFMHWGSGYECAEVGILNRQILFQGDESSLTSSFGGQFVIRRPAKATIRGLEVTRFGQRGFLGRYPIHWHFGRNVSGLGYYVKDSSIHDVFSRCIVVHNTQGVEVSNNIAFNTLGHCYFLEDGPEMDNVFDHNLGVLAKSEPSSIALTPEDTTAAVFWITHPRNVFTRNVAVEAAQGFWFALPSAAIGLSASEYNSSMNPSTSPLGIFDDNVAHGTYMNGYFIEYSPRNGAVFNRNNVYKSRFRGAWLLGNSLKWTGSVIADNLNGFIGVPVPGLSMIENSLVIGDTDNIGTPTPREGSRSRPIQGNANAAISAYETYDLPPPQLASGVTFVNFTRVGNRSAGVITKKYGASCYYPAGLALRSSNITMINSTEVILPDPCTTSFVFLDTDGSLTGMKPAAWLVANASLFINPDCIPKPEWPGYLCPIFAEGYNSLSISLGDSEHYPYNEPIYNGFYSNRSYTGRRLQVYETLTSASLNTDLYPGDSMTFNINYKSRRTIGVRFLNYITPNYLAINLYDWTYFAIPYAPCAFPITIPTMTQVYSFDQLSDRMKWFYDNATQHLYFKSTVESVTPRNIFGYLLEEFENSMTIKIYANRSCASSPQFSAINIFNPETRFEADLTVCQANKALALIANGIGKAFFIYEESTKRITYGIYHTLQTNVTSITLRNNKNNAVVMNLRTLSPVRSGFIPTKNFFDLLISGKIDIVISSTQFSEHLRGTLGVKGNYSSLPTRTLIANPCLPSALNVLPFSREKPLGTEWSVNTGTSTFVWNSTENVLCGNYSMKLTFATNWISINLNSTLNISSTQFQFFEFWALAAGADIQSLSMGFYGRNLNRVIPIISDYIENIGIDSLGWTRIRIPLSDASFAPAQLFTSIVLRATNTTIYFDNMSFVGNVSTESTYQSISASQVVSYVPAPTCIGSITGNIDNESKAGSHSAAISGVLGIILILAVLAV